MAASKNGQAGMRMPISQVLPDFIVNSSTNDFQVEPNITTLADGRVVMTWRSFDNGDGTTSAIHARIFNANGTPTGPDFLVASTTADQQSNPSVAVLANGNIVFAWESTDTADGSEGCIRTRIFSDTGTAVAADFVSNTTTAGQQYAPTVTALTDGRFLLTWDHYGEEDGPGDEIHARLFNADGTPVGADFVANSTLTGIQSAASVSALSGGRFVMTWMSDDTGDGSLGTVRARIFNAGGTASGADFIVNTTTAEDQTSPAVAVLADGRMVFTWQSNDSGDGDLSCIRARIYGASGVPTGADFIVNTTGAGSQSDVAITALADGRFVMAWASSDDGDGSGGCIRARLFNLDGTPAGDDFIINTTAADYQVTPALTALQNGNFQISWMSLDTGDGSQSTIRSTIYNPNVFYGTPNADTWTGGNLSDAIYGNDGDDLLYGKGGADIIDGGNGNDHLWGGNGADQLIGGAGFDFARYDDANYGDLTIRLDDSALNVGGAAIGDTYSGIEGLIGGAGNDTIFGNSANNYLYGLSGNDFIDGGAGNDTMVGGDGNDTYFVDNASDTVTETNTVLATGGDDVVNFSGTSGTYTLSTNIERLTILGTAAINGTGNALNNTIIGNSAANILDGNTGNDTLIGGDGNDTYFVDSSSDIVTETNAVLATGGDDLVNFSGTSGTYTLGANIERLTLLGTAAINGTGNALNNTITGNSAANIIDGGAGDDTMNGGDGNDTYYADSGSDVVSETNAVMATGGDDQVYFSGTTGTFTLGSNIERLNLIGTAAINGTGNALNNTITGNSAANIIDGGAGDDMMNGGDGSDTYYVDSPGDVVSETNAVLATGGDDLIYFTGTTGTYTLGANIERLTLLGTSAINGTGNALNNTITGNDGNNYLSGLDGNDILTGGNGSDQLWGGLGADQLIGGNDAGVDYARYDDANYGDLTIRLDNAALNVGAAAVSDTYTGIEGLVGGVGNDTIYGDGANNFLFGLAGNDIINGGDGNDSMYGGDGNDTFFANTVSDIIFETNTVFATGGDDLVNFTGTTGTYTLGANIERLALLGTAAINGAGNSLNNTITGNSAANIIDGGAGDDTMNGGDGNDTYFVDSASDTVTETNAVLATGGDDLVNFSAASGTYTLGANIERLTLLGTAAINGTGNTLNNTITGNAAANILDGGTGNDTLIGGDGNDTYLVDSISDIVNETNTVLATGGDDLVNFSGTSGTYVLAANVERLTLLGAAAINGTGNALNNTITGNGAANIIDGAAGDDTMNGGDGNDTYFVDSFGDVVSETNAVMATGGDDQVYFSGTTGTFTLGTNIERLNLLGTSAINGTGNALNNTMVGNSAANILDGGVGNDTMSGGDGSDTYYVDSFSDVVSETNAVLATGGDDLIYFTGTTGTYTLGANVERLTLLGTSAINGTGNALNNTIMGNSAANTLDGQSGNDILDGGAGIDTMIGGDGNDIYYADVFNDVVTETNATLASGGDDLVYFTGTTGNFTLGSNVERLTLTGSAAIGGIGNALNNTIIGNTGINQLYGGDGNDILDGGDGNDQLYGGNGSDQYIGGAGLDFARYDDANYGSLVINLANPSLNTGAAAGDTYVGIEGVVGGAGYDRIYGNSADNYLYGGDFYDDLYGGDGNDFMVGGNSDDWFFGGNGADTMDGGIDTFVDYARYDDANYGNLTIRLDNSALNTGAAAGDVYINIEGVVGGAGNDIIYGNALANYIFGQGGTDTIDGKEGNDNLWGGTAANRFQFSTTLDATNNVDAIKDFVAGTDDILLAQSIFSAIGATLDASEFRLGTAAADANDYIIYNSATGQIYYDANGNGAGGQTLFATVTSGIALTINDFIMV